MGDDWNAGAGGGDDWNGGAGGGDTWNGDGGGNDGFDDGFKPESGDARNHVDNHDADGPGGGDGGACRNCGEEGHFARECPEPKKMSGNCFYCGEVGHNRADCPKEGASDCRACGGNGHKASECEENRKIDRSNIPDMDTEAAWNMIKEAADDKDMGEVKKAIDIYIKADETITYQQLEEKFRASEIPVYCIAQEMEIPQTMSLVNFQGKQNCKYVVGYFFSDKPKRKIFAEGWPQNKEQNIERLADAGVPMESFVPLCRNCKQLGHISKACPEERIEQADKVTVTCNNCGEEGHRMRDCPSERQKRGGAAKDCRKCGETGHMAKDCPNAEASGGGGRACHNCGSEEHMARDCTEPRKQTCRNCGEEGHMSRECEKPRDPSTVTCRNCDQVGHFSKQCPEPKDWSKVKCSNCGEMGHTIKRCKKDPEEVGDQFGTSAGGDDFGTSADGGTNDQSWNNADSGEPSWNTGAPEVSAGGW